MIECEPNILIQMEYGQGIHQNLLRAVKYYRSSVEQNIEAAQNSFGICVERGIGVHKDQFLAAQYYQHAADQGHVDGANNLGFCLEHDCGVKQDIQLATKYITNLRQIRVILIHLPLIDLRIFSAISSRIQNCWMRIQRCFHPRHNWFQIQRKFHNAIPLNN
jgi:hypothetical protein